ncbi:NF-kappa-B inhibitor-interacting Ras-like protein 2 [Tribolium castaneum]|uniref:NF-kappa-B inhibitor-interacting Ras-like protein n=1 Tax=Tribolium castaneum TaxID=7070 RepID=A0A139WE77_TRICA|nr:PREDICTED: NF-kappa-B inhibitor-interacting Ras-like protein 2 [Tribolium castaneum]KYB26253.1 NF-kappa-B inhibitor-interacting Ras-like protein [Tribolium castaneum]|eukprot:XP_974024.1 PREDICTED: NF-kappa-B inhibitor-interacting Ras-like protein 2 [Tribolium castaneum]
MGKTSKVVICGMKGVGKTAVLEQVIYGNITSKSELHSTIEDIYVANIESDKGTREKVRFYDTAGLEPLQTATASGTTNQQLPRHYLAIADGYILVYDTEKSESLDMLVSLKKDIDKNKDKKEVTIIVIGNKFKETENTEFDSTLSKATAWCNREKLRHFTASAMHRITLYEPFVHITSKLNPPPSKSTFTPLSMGRKVKDQS